MFVHILQMQSKPQSHLDKVGLETIRYLQLDQDLQNKWLLPLHLKIQSGISKMILLGTL